MIQSISSVDYVISDYVNPKTKPTMKDRRYLLQMDIRLDDYEIQVKLNKRNLDAIGSGDFTNWKPPRWNYTLSREGELLKEGRLYPALVNSARQQINQDADVGSVVQLRLVETFASIIMFSDYEVGIGSLEMDIFKRLQRTPWMMASPATGSLASMRFVMTIPTASALGAHRRLLLNTLPTGEIVITGIDTNWWLNTGSEEDPASVRLTMHDVSRPKDDGVIYPLDARRMANKMNALLR